MDEQDISDEQLGSIDQFLSLQARDSSRVWIYRSIGYLEPGQKPNLVQPGQWWCRYIGDARDFFYGDAMLRARVNPAVLQSRLWNYSLAFQELYKFPGEISSHFEQVSLVHPSLW